MNISQKELKQLLNLLEKLALSGTEGSKSIEQLKKEQKKGKNLIISEEEQSKIHEVQGIVFDCLWE